MEGKTIKIKNRALSLHICALDNEKKVSDELFEIMEKEYKRGAPGLAITDRNSLKGFHHVYHISRRYTDFKIIYGMEISVLDGIEEYNNRNTHRTEPDVITILVKMQEGMTNLYHISTEMNLNNASKIEGIGRDLLYQYRSGLLLGSGRANSTLLEALLNNEYNKAEKIAIDYDFLELLTLNELSNKKHNNAEDLSMKIIEEINKKIIELGSKLGICVCETGYEVFGQIEEVTPLPSKEFQLKFGNFTQLKELCYQRLNKFYEEKIPEKVMTRVKEELKTIKEMNYSSAFLTYYKIAAFFKTHGYFYSVKGFMGYSYIAYLLGITETDAISTAYFLENYELPTDTYLNAGSANGWGSIFVLSERVRKKVKEMLINLPDFAAMVLCNNDFNKNLYNYILFPAGCNLDEYTPLKYSESGELSTVFDLDVVMNEGILSFYTDSSVEVIDRIEENKAIRDGNSWTYIDQLDNKVLKFMCEENYIKVLDTLGLSLFSEEASNIKTKAKPVTFMDLVKINGFLQGTGIWEDNAEKLVEQGFLLQDIPAEREDIFLYLEKLGVNYINSFKIAERVRKGKGIQMSNEIMLHLEEHNIPLWFVEFCESVKYLYSAFNSIKEVMMEYKIAYYYIYKVDEFLRAIEI